MAQSQSPLKPAPASAAKVVVRDISMPGNLTTAIPKSAVPQVKKNVDSAGNPAKSVASVPPTSKMQIAPAANAGGKQQVAEAERRRSQRVLLVVQVEVSWVSKDGIRVKEHAETEVVSLHGAMVKMETKLSVNSQLDVARPSIGKSVKARVVGTCNPGQDGMARIAIEILTPCDNFWGISFPPMA